MNRHERQARALLASIAQEASGHSLRMVCPFCNGGASSEHSLVLTLRDDGAFYCCHRASCGEKGVLDRTRGALPMEPKVSKFQPRELVAARTMLPHAHKWADVFRKATGMNSEAAAMAGFYVDADYPSTLILECRDMLGGVLGHQTREGYPGEGRRTTRTYKITEGPFYHFVYDLAGLGSTRLVIVEDAFSAAAVASHGYNGLALLGTHLSEELAYEIACRNFTQIGVALDPGAEKQTWTVAERMAVYYGKPVHRMYLRDDPKDLPRQELADALAYAFEGRING